jgi:hypothetical protein
MKRLQIIDSTTVSLFSNLIFKGVGRNPKTGKKKGGIKVHKVIRAVEGVASDIKFTSAATHDSFMFVAEEFNKGELLAMDRAYIDYEKLEKLTQRGVIYVTKMKKGLKYKVLSDVMYMDAKNGMAYRIQEVEFTKKKSKKSEECADGGKDTPQEQATVEGEKNGEQIITHRARIVTYPDIKKIQGKGRQGDCQGQDGVIADQRLHDGRRGHHRHLQKTLGDRDALSPDQTEFPAALLLWRECQRHQDTNLGDAHSKFTAHADAEEYQEEMEFLGTGHHDTNPTHVLCGLPSVL